jgi:hypothetical protein
LKILPRIRKIITLGALAGGLLLVFSDHLPAGLTRAEYSTLVEINGVNFGTVDKVVGLEAAMALSNTYKYSAKPEQQISTITLHRDFVTAPSLYLWARNSVAERNGAQNIHLITQNQSGQEIGRKVLNFSLPLSWSFESAGHAAGGFHETIELAVRKVSSKD